MTARRRIRIAAGASAAGLCVLAAQGGCFDTGPPPATPPPAWLATPLSAAVPAASGSAGVEAVAASVVDPSVPVFDPAAIGVVLDDPRLAEVKEALGREAVKRAADALEDALGKLSPDAPERPAWSYRLGLLRRDAGEPMAAVRAFDAAATAGFPLTDHARVRAAELLLALTEPTQALARLAAVSPGTPLDAQASALRPRALAASGDMAAAADAWRSYIARSPRPSDWQSVALAFARALLAHPSEAHAEEAARVARVVITEGGRSVAEARALEEEALATVPLVRRDSFETPAELARVALGLAEGGDARAALKASERALSAAAKVTGDEALRLSCDGHIAKGKALTTLRRHGEALDAFGHAVDACKGGPREPQAAFLAGRSAARGGQQAEARRRFAYVESQFPTSNLADDARLLGAEAALKLGDEAAFVSLLSRIADDYPTGDMVDQGLFALALELVDRGDWAGAVVPLERAVALQVRGRPYHAEGRPQYFLARAKLALGLVDEAKAGFVGVVKDFPASYYMVLAYARLARLDPAAAAAVVADGAAAEATGSFVIPDDPALHTPGFVRAIELVRQGEGADALDELTLLGVRDRSAEPSLLWASAFLLARIESPAESHGVLRRASRLWTEHHPVGVWRSVWELAYPRPYARVVTDQASRSGTPDLLCYAIMREESAFGPRALSSAGARGLMQLMPATAKQVAKPLGLPSSDSALQRPEINVALGAHLLASLMRKFPHAPLLAIPSYNAGPGATKRWLRARPEAEFDVFVERVPYEETRNYTKRVIGSLAAYATLYGDGMREPLLMLPDRVTTESDAAADDG